MGGLPLAEIEFRVAVLPPISRGAHLAGPQLHAERLIELWRTDDDVPLAEAFRVLNVETVAGVIWRTVAAEITTRAIPAIGIFRRSRTCCRRCGKPHGTKSSPAGSCSKSSRVSAGAGTILWRQLCCRD